MGEKSLRRFKVNEGDLVLTIRHFANDSSLNLAIFSQYLDRTSKKLDDRFLASEACSIEHPTRLRASLFPAIIPRTDPSVANLLSEGYKIPNLDILRTPEGEAPNENSFYRLRAVGIYVCASEIVIAKNLKDISKAFDMLQKMWPDKNWGFYTKFFNEYSVSKK